MAKNKKKSSDPKPTALPPASDSPDAPLEDVFAAGLAPKPADQIEVGDAPQDDDTVTITDNDPDDSEPDDITVGDDPLTLQNENAKLPANVKPLAEKDRRAVIGMIEKWLKVERVDATRAASKLTDAEKVQIHGLQADPDPTLLIASIVADAELRHAETVQKEAAARLKAAQEKTASTPS